MAKTKAKEKIERVAVTYDLYDLPTAQHKAGLAGLVLQVKSMVERELPPKSIPDVEMVSPTTVKATFTESSVRALFDDLYDAVIVEVRSGSKWQKKKPKRVETTEEPDTKTGKIKKKTWYFYDVVQPRGNFLRQYTDDGKELWHKLWREMLWTIPRGKPTTRTPFNTRAKDKPCKEGTDAWRELLAVEKAKRNNELRTGEVAGAILLGAQAVNAEAVPFRDQVEHALLLHFWQLTMRIFVPEHVNTNGDREFVGYLLAIPEVSDLKKFCKYFKRALSSLDPKLHRYRPAAAIISLPEQGALEFMDHLARLAGELTSSDMDEVARALAGVEYFHMDKEGNNIKTKAHGRIATRADLLREYVAIKKDYRNPMFLSARLLALLRGKRWYEEFPDQFATRPWEFFIQSRQTGRKTPESMLSFVWDARHRFGVIKDNQPKREAKTMPKTEDELAEKLEAVIYRLIHKYVNKKTEDKSEIKYESFKNKEVKDEKTGKERMDVPIKYRDAREKLCSGTFLGFRSRREDDFVNYFTSTIGSVSQWLPEDDYLVVASALMRQDATPNWQNVKTLAMLALSAAS